MSKKVDSKHDQHFEDVELWETKQLGVSAKHAKPATVKDDKALDDDLGLAPISLRLQKDVVAKLKVMAKQEGLGYQTYIRQILSRHVREVTVASSAKKRDSA